jgi:3-hydroxy-5-methyl-1-naphthoate 3-O-methyltransferase
MTPLDPAPLISMATAYWNSATLIAAVKLGVFDAIAQGSTQLDDIAHKLNADKIATDALLTALLALDLLERSEGHYRNTALSQTYLVSDQPQSLKGALLYNADVYPLWGHLGDVVQRGDTKRDPWAYLGGDLEQTRRFVYGMHHRALGVGRAVSNVINLAGVHYLADVGGGPGTYSALLCQKYPSLRADVLDLPAVVGVAEEIMVQMEASEKVSCLAYDYYKDDLPENPYDAALISGVLHREQPAQVQMMFNSISKRLPIGGQLWISDVMLNDDRTGPLFGAMFALNMRVLSHDGRCHSVAEQKSWLNDAGFEVLNTHRLPPPINYTLIHAQKVR